MGPFIVAPSSMSRSIMCFKPSFAAAWSAVHPYRLLTKSRSAPLLARYLSRLSFPRVQAQYTLQNVLVSQADRHMLLSDGSWTHASPFPPLTSAPFSRSSSTNSKSPSVTHSTASVKGVSYPTWRFGSAPRRRSSLTMSFSPLAIGPRHSSCSPERSRLADRNAKARRSSRFCQR